MDGELWTERNDFEKCVSIVKRQDENDEWKEVKFMVFDTLEMKGKPFNERLERIADFRFSKVGDSSPCEIKFFKLMSVLIKNSKENIYLMRGMKKSLNNYLKSGYV